MTTAAVPTLLTAISLPCVSCGEPALTIQPLPVSQMDATVQGLLQTVVMGARAKLALMGKRLELEPDQNPIALIPPAKIAEYLGVRCEDCRAARVEVSHG